jgi:hypothetical protein
MKHTVAVPRPVYVAMTAWFVAISAGVAEALIRTTQPGGPTAGQLAIRFAIYAALAVLVAALPSGRDIVRWALAIILGGLGTLSLIAGPVGWLLAGGSPTAFLAAANAPTLLILVVRLVHLGAVVLAVVAMFQPAANRFFSAWQASARLRHSNDEPRYRTARD